MYCLNYLVCCFFFFKQKTAYEMRISDWSSDVCSSDLELQRLLSRLQFNAMQDRFDCTRADLIRLGKKADPNITDDGAALAYGASQFKVNFQQLREVYAESGWAKKNILIGEIGRAHV